MRCRKDGMDFLGERRSEVIYTDSISVLCVAAMGTRASRSPEQCSSMHRNLAVGSGVRRCSLR